jgi:hypothetical protein
MLKVLQLDKFVQGTVLKYDPSTGMYIRSQFARGSGCVVNGMFPLSTSMVTMDFTTPNAVYVGRVVGEVAQTSTKLLTGVAIYNNQRKRTHAQSSSFNTVFPLDANGSNYVGGWNDGLFHGHGVLTFTHPCVGRMKYTGAWVEGNMRGHAVLVFGQDFQYEWDTEWGSNNTLVQSYCWGVHSKHTNAELFETLPKSHAENGVVSHFRIQGKFPDKFVEQSSYLIYDELERDYLNQQQNRMMTHHIAVVYKVNRTTDTSMLYSGVKYAKDEFDVFKTVMNDAYPIEWATHTQCTMAYFPLMYTTHERRLLSDTTVIFYEAQLDENVNRELERLMNEAVTTDVNAGQDVHTTYDYNEFELVSVVGISLPKRSLDWLSAVSENMASKRQWPETKEWVKTMVQTYNTSTNKDDISVLEQVKITTDCPMRTTNAIKRTGLDLFPDDTMFPNRSRRNEHYLFHGTSSTLSIASILCDRYNIPENSSGSMMGRALYMSDHFAKADQYNSIDRVPRNFSPQQTSDELNKRLQTQNALLRLIGLFKGNPDDALDASAYDPVLTHLNSVDQKRVNQPRTLNIMLVFRTVMGVTLQLSHFDEFEPNSVNIQTGNPNPTTINFGLKPSQPFDNDLFQRDDVSDADYRPIDGITSNMSSMKRLNPRFDSVTIRSWDLNGFGNRMRFPEHLLYDKSAQNALPVAMIVYSRKLNPSKPYALRGGGTSGSHIPNQELDRSRYKVQSLDSIEQFLN